MPAPYYVDKAQPDVIEYVKTRLAGNPPEQISEDLSDRVRQFAEQRDAVIELAIDVLRDGGTVPAEGVSINGVQVGELGGRDFVGRISDYFLKYYEGEYEGQGQRAVLANNNGRISGDLAFDGDSAPHSYVAKVDKLDPDRYTNGVPDVFWHRGAVIEEVNDANAGFTLNETYLEIKDMVKEDFDYIPSSLKGISSASLDDLTLFFDNLDSFSQQLSDEIGGKFSPEELRQIIYTHVQDETGNHDIPLEQLRQRKQELFEQRLEDNARKADAVQDGASRDDWSSAEDMFTAARQIDKGALSQSFSVVADVAPQPAPDVSRSNNLTVAALG